MFTLKTKKSGRSATVTARTVFDRAFLDTVGKVIRDEIVKEAKKQAARDLKKTSGYRPFVIDEADHHDVKSTPEGIPRSPRFFDSFKWRVVGTKVEIYSDWPFIEVIVEGKKPYKMDWLTSGKGINKVPFSDPSGKVKVLSTPPSHDKKGNVVQDAWIHPGFAEHDFIQKGWKNAAPKVRKMYAIQTFKEGIKKAFG